MHRPVVESGHEPKRVRVRKNPRWTELFPHLREIGVEPVVDSDLDTLRTAFCDHLRRVRDARRKGTVQPTARVYASKLHQIICSGLTKSTPGSYDSPRQA